MTAGAGAPVNDLAAFLAARLGEDEATAKAAPGLSWTAHAEDDIAGASVYDEQWVLLYPQRYDHDNALSNRPGATGPQYIQQARDKLAAHIARHDPARVLREVAAGRRLLARYEDLQHPKTLLERGTFPMLAEVLLACIRDRAAVYDYHPDYRAEWKP